MGQEQMPKEGLVDRTPEFSELLDQFAKLMTEVSRSSKTVKALEQLLETSDKGAQETIAGSQNEITILVKQQYEMFKQANEALRTQLDAVAAKLREKGQGFVIEGYEERLAILDNK